MDSKEETPNSKFFNKKEYKTLVVKPGQEESIPLNSKTDIDRLIELLTNPIHRETKEDVLVILKTQKNTDALIDAILENKEPAKRHLLIAACWEADLDCSEHLLFFTGLAIQDEYLPAMESITVIENMGGGYKKQDAEKALKKVKDALLSVNTEKKQLLLDLEAILEKYT